MMVAMYPLANAKYKKDTAHIFKGTIHPTLQKGINKIEHLSNITSYMPAEMMSTTASDDRRNTTVRTTFTNPITTCSSTGP